VIIACAAQQFIRTKPQACRRISKSDDIAGSCERDQTREQTHQEYQSWMALPRTRPSSWYWERCSGRPTSNRAKWLWRPSIRVCAEPVVYLARQSPALVQRCIGPIALWLKCKRFVRGNQQHLVKDIFCARPSLTRSHFECCRWKVWVWRALVCRPFWRRLEAKLLHL